MDRQDLASRHALPGRVAGRGIVCIYSLQPSETKNVLPCASLCERLFGRKNIVILLN